MEADRNDECIWYDVEELRSSTSATSTERILTMSHPIATRIEKFMEAGSWIRRMFEEGATMKKEFGVDNVFDFSLGNPIGNPPNEFIKALRDVLDEDIPMKHGYMPNAGFPNLRQDLARYLSSEYGVPLQGNNLVMTVGAAGAMNVALKALVNPDETVLIFAPFFVEYRFYIDNVGARCRIVETDKTFNLDVSAIEKALDRSVKALIINTPNNPTGRVYPEETLREVSDLVAAASREYGHPIYLLSDEPYKRIVYDGIVPPSLLRLSENAIICTSYSKELCIAGERLGYIAVHPSCPDVERIMGALTFCNRILGFVNAPALMQRALHHSIGTAVDITTYEKNRTLFLSALKTMGYDIVTPEGAFYLFPRTPIEDDVDFIAELKKEQILAVPGRGFGRAGYMRLAYCVATSVIERALPGFERAIQRMKA